MKSALRTEELSAVHGDQNYRWRLQSTGQLVTWDAAVHAWIIHVGKKEAMLASVLDPHVAILRASGDVFIRVAADLDWAA